MDTPAQVLTNTGNGDVAYFDTEFCLAVCQNEVLNTAEGVITSPDYPQPYSRLTNCDWTIKVKIFLQLLYLLHLQLCNKSTIRYCEVMQNFSQKQFYCCCTLYNPWLPGGRKESTQKKEYRKPKSYYCI